MRKNKSKGGLTILAIILCLLLLVLGGYIFYDKVLKENVSTYNYKLSKRTNLQAVRGEYIEVLVDSEGNAYLYTLGNVDSDNSSQIDLNIKKLESQFKVYSPKGYTYFDGSNELKAYKLNIKNILTSYYIHQGNGGFSYFVFLKENGELSYLSYDKLIYDGEIELKDIDNLDNVVSVVENTYSMNPYAITSNGSEILLNDYIK